MQIETEVTKPTKVNGTTFQTPFEIKDASTEALITENIKKVAMLGVTLRLKTSTLYQPALIANVIPAAMPLISDKLMS